VLEKQFLIMKVTYDEENRNEAFLKAYPDVPAYPHFFVLASDGAFLHSQGTAELEEGRGYNEEVFLAFLAKWKPEEVAEDDQEEERPDAEEVLAAGLEQARAEKKKVLIHLGAPS
jgi:hypothetical protein